MLIAIGRMLRNVNHVWVFVYVFLMGIGKSIRGPPSTLFGTTLFMFLVHREFGVLNFQGSENWLGNQTTRPNGVPMSQVHVMEFLVAAWRRRRRRPSLAKYRCPGSHINRLMPLINRLTLLINWVMPWIERLMQSVNGLRPLVDRFMPLSNQIMAWTNPYVYVKNVENKPIRETTLAKIWYCCWSQEDLQMTPEKFLRCQHNYEKWFHTDAKAIPKMNPTCTPKCSWNDSPARLQKDPNTIPKWYESIWERSRSHP